MIFKISGDKKILGIFIPFVSSGDNFWGAFLSLLSVLGIKKNGHFYPFCQSISTSMMKLNNFRTEIRQN
jgi:hypothetical protein